MSYIRELQDVIWELHGVASRHVGTVPVKETLGGDAVWEGNVEIFDLHAHPKTHRVYAWAHDTGDPRRPKRHVTVLHIHPITSPELAVRTAIAQEFKNLGTEES